MAGNDLLPLLRHRLRGSYSPVLADTVGSILLTAGGMANWSLLIDYGRVTARPGLAGQPATTVKGSLAVLRDVVSGTRSGVKAFLDGDLVVRGNLSLSLQLDGLFIGDERVAATHTRARLVTAGGVETFYLEAGPIDAPPVVLVHGLGATNASMLPLMDALATDFRVIAPDLPGHGGSRAPRNAYAPQHLGNWLIAFAGAVSDEPVTLIGNSLGGRTAIEAGLLAPDMVLGLVLLCPAVAFRRLRQFVPVVRLLRPELAALPVRIPRSVALSGLRSMFADPSRLHDVWYEAAVDEFIRVMQQRERRVAFFAALREVYLDKAFGEDGFWDRLPELEPPSLFIWGDRDILVPAGFARHVEKSLPDSTSVVIHSCGHAPQFEHPKQTAELTREFLDRLAAPRKEARRAARRR